MRRRRKHDDTEVALANFALTFAKALLVFCVILFLLINPKQREEDGVKPKIEYLITIEWPKNVDYDVDVWIRDPEEKVLYYDKKEVDFLNLERDDLGSKNDSVSLNGGVIKVENNQELVSIRGFKPGEYVINAHLYSADRSSNARPVYPITVTITIQKMNPNVTTVYRGTAELSTVRQEVHIVRFNLDSDGRSSGFSNDMPVLLREGVSDDGGGRFDSPTLPPAMPGVEQ